MNDYQNAFTFVPTYGDKSTAYHFYMISVVVFFYSNTLKSMLVDYAVTQMGCFDDYLDAAPHAKTMRRNGITIFLLHVAQCINIHQTKFVTSTLVAQALLKSFYSRLSFKVIKDLAMSPNFEVDCKQFLLITKENLFAITAVIAQRYSLVINKVCNTEDMGLNPNSANELFYVIIAHQLRQYNATCTYRNSCMSHQRCED